MGPGSFGGIIVATNAGFVADPPGVMLAMIRGSGCTAMPELR